MKQYAIFTDSSADLPISMTEELDIGVLQLSVTLEGEATLPNDKVDVK